MVLIRPAAYPVKPLKKKNYRRGYQLKVLTVEMGRLFTPSHKVLVRSHLEFWVQVRSVPFKKA